MKFINLIPKEPNVTESVAMLHLPTTNHGLDVLPDSNPVAASMLACGCEQDPIDPGYGNF